MNQEAYETMHQLRRLLMYVNCGTAASSFRSPAHAAADMLVGNWNQRICGDGASVEDVAGDIDKVVETLLKFKEETLALSPSAAPAPGR